MIRRSKPLERTGLKPPTAEQVAAWQSKPRKPIARTRLKRGKGRKALREADAIAAFRAALIERSGSECESTDPYACGRLGIRHKGAHPHHVWPEDRDEGRHDPDRGLWLCAASHRWAHENPAKAARAGMLRPS